MRSHLRKRIQGNQLSEYLPGDARTLEDFKERLQAYSNAAVVLEAEAAAEADPVRKAELTELAAVQKHNRDVYKAKREELNQLAAYEIEAGRLTPRATKEWLILGGAAVGAVVAMAVFTLVIDSGSKNGESSEDVKTPSLGEMVSASKSRDFWQRLNLDACKVDEIVPVVVFASDATTYTVQTLGTPRACERYRLSVPRDLVRVIEVEPVTVEVKTTPSP